MLKNNKYKKAGCVNKNKSQAGSAHLILTIVLALALFGLLGFELYQNYATSKISDSTPMVAEDNVQKTEGVREVALTEIASDTMLSTGLALKYPKTWKVTHEAVGPLGGEDIRSEIYDIASPDGKTIVHFALTNGGFGGTCDESAGDELVQINVDEIPGYAEARFVDYYGLDYYYAGMQPNNEEVRSFKVGDSGCLFGKAGNRGSLAPISNSGALENVALRRLDMELVDVGNNGVSSVEKFKKVITTDDFNTAKRIIQSLYKKD